MTKKIAKFKLQIYFQNITSVLTPMNFFLQTQNKMKSVANNSVLGFRV